MHLDGCPHRDVIVGILSPGGGIMCIYYQSTPGVAGVAGVALKDVCV